jgi:acetyl-CoA carboxylase beta subunit
MQEGIFSLMQMAKTASAAALLEDTRTPLFLVLTNPPPGGDSIVRNARDVILAELARHRFAGRGLSKGPSDRSCLMDSSVRSSN